MSRFIPVDPEKWAKMVQAQSDLPRWKEMCDELDARCNELKAENARLRASSFVTAVPVEEYEKLKAEVERLENLVRYWSEKYQNENARFLRASERIAAKEGKPSV